MITLRWIFPIDRNNDIISFSRIVNLSFIFISSHSAKLRSSRMEYFREYWFCLPVMSHAKILNSSSFSPNLCYMSYCWVVIMILIRFPYCLKVAMRSSFESTLNCDREDIIVCSYAWMNFVICALRTSSCNFLAGTNLYSQVCPRTDLSGSKTCWSYDPDNDGDFLFYSISIEHRTWNQEEQNPCAN